MAWNTFRHHKHLLKGSALSLHWIWGKLTYNCKSSLVLHANTEKLQYVSLKYDKLTRENLIYSANVRAVGVYTVLITSKYYSQKFKFGIRVNKVWVFIRVTNSLDGVFKINRVTEWVLWGGRLFACDIV